MGPAESPVLCNSAFILPSFFKHTISFLFPDPDYALKHRDHQVTRAGLGWQCASVNADLCMHMPGRTTRFQARHQHWTTIPMEYMKGNMEIGGQLFPVSAGKTGSIHNNEQGFRIMELLLYAFSW